MFTASYLFSGKINPSKNYDYKRKSESYKKNEKISCYENALTILLKFVCIGIFT